MKNGLVVLIFLLSSVLRAEGNRLKELATPQSPPLLTDDPNTPGPSTWELNVSLTGDLTPSRRVYDLPLLDLNYGIGETWQLKYEVPWNFVDQVNTRRLYTAGDSKVGIKYEFFEDHEHELKLAFYPQYTFVTPGSELVPNNLTSGEPIVTLPLLIAKSADRVNYAVNLGYNIPTNPNDQDRESFYSSFATGWYFSSRGSLLTEIWGDWVPSTFERSALFNVGTMDEINPDTIFYCSVGHQIGFNSSGESPLFILIGLKFIGR